MTTSNGVKRAAVLAAANSPVPRPVALAVYTPWNVVLENAQGEYQAAMSAMLSELDATTTQATRLLDVAEQTANNARSKLQAAAWFAFNHYMTMANAVYSDIMTPATDKYKQLVDEAHDQFNASMNTASVAYKKVLSDVDLMRGNTTHIVPQYDALAKAAVAPVKAPPPNAPPVG